MKLYDKLPDSVIVNGRRIKLDLDFRNVLRMIDILAADDLMDDAREWLAMRCICRKPQKGMVEEVRRLLFPPGNKAHDRVMDYEQDADLIKAAFQQAYGIDLNTAKLHWLRFSCLLAGIPECTRFSEVISIRTRPIPELTKYNAKEVQNLMEAKASVSLKMSEKEQKEKYQKDVQNVAALLLSMAEGE